MDLRLAIGLVGSALLVAGMATGMLQRKNTLFAVGNACMFTYALLGYLAGGPVFFVILQTFIACSTVCMLLRVPDRYNTPILAMAGVGLVAWSLALFEGWHTAIFVAGLVLLGIGFAMDAGTRRREWAFLLGSAVIAVFSLLLRDWVFVALNGLFALFAAKNLAGMRR